MKKSPNFSKSNALRLSWLSLVAVAMPLQFAEAASVSWQATGTSGWLTDTNWTSNAAPLLSDTATISNGGTAHVGVAPGEAAVAGILYVGGNAVASFGGLQVDNGSTLSGTTANFGYWASSTGAGSVSGVGSGLSFSTSLFVGHSGTGTLSISNGATVNVGATGIGHANAAARGTLTVEGVGTSWTSTGHMYVGNVGQGVLEVKDGASVVNKAQTFIGGYNTNGSGTSTVTVSSGATLSSSNGLVLGGGHGSGVLNIITGGTVSVGNAVSYIGSSASANSTQNSLMTVDGAGSLFSLTSSLVVGSSGTGTLRVTNGGRASVSSTIIGGGVHAGKLLLDGADSELTSSAFYLGSSGVGTGTISNGAKASATLVYVGQAAAGNGTLDITTGGTMNNATGYIGATITANAVNGVGKVTVDGTGSAWNNTSALYIGGGAQATATSGTGELIVQKGGVVTSGTLKDGIYTGIVTLGRYAGGHGTLKIGNGNVAGEVKATSVNGGLGTGSVIFGQTDSITFAPKLTGNLTVSHTGAGTTVLTETNTYTGATTVTSGSLLVDGSISSPVTVSGVGTLGGSGTTGALTVAAGGAVAPGNGVGALTVSSATFADSATLSLDLNKDSLTGVAGTNWDQLKITGLLDVSTVSNGGITIVLNQSSVDGWIWDPQTPQTWTSFMTFGSASGNLSPTLFHIDSSQFSGPGTWSIVQNANSFDLQYHVVPEPGTWVMLLGGVGILMGFQRSRRTVGMTHSDARGRA